MTARELAFRSEDLEVVVLPDVGGRLHRVRAFGEEVLRTPDDPSAHLTDGFSWGAYVMAPWCNRAAPGPREVAGRQIDLAQNFPDGTAIHGLVASAPWSDRGGGELVHRRESAGDWPWPFEVVARIRVDGPTLRLDYRLTNLDAAAPMPAGMGLHPWFRRPVEVRVPAERVYPSNVSSPESAVPVAGERDLRVAGPPAEGLDATWTALSEPRVELTWPEVGIRGTCDIETDAGAVLITLAAPSGMDATAVEPQTHGPDPLRRLAASEPDAPALLPPGAALHLGLRLRFERHGYG